MSLACPELHRRVEWPFIGGWYYTVRLKPLAICFYCDLSYLFLAAIDFDIHYYL